MPDVLVPIFAIMFLFGAPVAAWIVSRVLAHNEYMAMLRSGMAPPPDSRMFRRAMRHGWAPPPGGYGQPGPGQPTGAPGYGAAPDSSYYEWGGQYGGGAWYGGWNPQRKLQKGITVALIGLAILIGLSFISPGHVGPWLLGGLIPMFVGIAQVISAVLAGAQFGGFGGQPMGGAPNQQQTGFQNRTSGPFGGPQPPPPPSTPTSGSTYGWRPGATPGIEKPAQPPDQANR